MAFPTLVSTTVSQNNGNDTKIVVSMPAVVATDDLLLMLEQNVNDDVGGTITPAGWTLIINDEDGANIRYHLFAKKALGSEGGTTVTINYADNTIAAIAQVYRIQNWRNSGNLANDVKASTQFGSGGNPDPANLAPGFGAEDFMWFATVHGDLTGFSAANIPTNYTNGLKTNMNASFPFDKYAMLTSQRNLNAASENPGTFSATAAAHWFAVTIAVRTAGISPRLGEVSWLEFETPPFPNRQGRITQIELQTPDFTKSAVIPFVEFEVPDVGPAQAFPVVQYVAESVQRTQATSLTINFPPVVNASELLLLIVSTVFDTSSIVTGPAGFTLLFNLDDGDASRWYVYGKSAVGNEAGTTVTFTPGDSASMAAQMYRITGWANTGTIANDIKVAGSLQVNSTPTSPPLNPSTWGTESTLWIILATQGIWELGVTTMPTNYCCAVHTDEGDDGFHNDQILTAYRNNAVDNEIPGPWGTIADPFRHVQTGTIAVRPLSVTDRSSRISFIELESPDFNRFAKIPFIEFQTPDVGGAVGNNRFLGLGLRNSMKESGE